MLPAEYDADSIIHRYKVAREGSAPEVLENSTFLSFGEIVFSDEEDEFTVIKAD